MTKSSVNPNEKNHPITDKQRERLHPVLGSSYTNLSQGTPATSSYGDLVTADSAGNFSFGLTDPRVEDESYAVYGVNNGEIQTGTLTVANSTIDFGQSSTLEYLSIGSFDSYVQANSNTTVTGLTSLINGGGVTLGGVGIDNGSNNEIADVYVEPQNSAGHHTGGALNQAATYNLSVIMAVKSTALMVCP